MLKEGGLQAQQVVREMYLQVQWVLKKVGYDVGGGKRGYSERRLVTGSMGDERSGAADAVVPPITKCF